MQCISSAFIVVYMCKSVHSSKEALHDNLSANETRVLTQYRIHFVTVAIYTVTFSNLTQNLKSPLVLETFIFYLNNVRQFVTVVSAIHTYYLHFSYSKYFLPFS
jgi:hypothetical protein